MGKRNSFLKVKRINKNSSRLAIYPYQFSISDSGRSAKIDRQIVGRLGSPARVYNASFRFKNSTLVDRLGSGWSSRSIAITNLNVFSYCFDGMDKKGPEQAL